MTTTSREIVDAILNKDHVNANEKIYDELYGKSSEELKVRKVEIAKHFFDPESQSDESPEETEASAEVEQGEEQSEETPEETPEQ